jgi:hypothetical protein
VRAANVAPRRARAPRLWIIAPRRASTCSETVDHCSTPCEHVLRDCGSLLRTVRARAPRPWSIAAHVNYSVTTTFPVVSRDSSARCASAI